MDGWMDINFLKDLALLIMYKDHNSKLITLAPEHERSKGPQEAKLKSCKYICTIASVSNC